jgi:hypothetical protein
VSDLNPRAEVLRTAESLVNGDRNNQYGEPHQDFARTATLWNTYLDLDEVIQPHDVAAMMMLLKLSRIHWSPDKQDSWVDAAGYAACGWDTVVNTILPEDANPVDEISPENRKSVESFLRSIFRDAPTSPPGYVEPNQAFGFTPGDQNWVLFNTDETTAPPTAEETALQIVNDHPAFKAASPERKTAWIEHLMREQGKRGNA